MLYGAARITKSIAEDDFTPRWTVETLVAILGPGSL